jgi:hypothetical protein
LAIPKDDTRYWGDGDDGKHERNSGEPIRPQGTGKEVATENEERHVDRKPNDVCDTKGQISDPDSNPDESGGGVGWTDVDDFANE